MGDTSLGSTVRALLACGKGVLAADESQPTIEKRFREVGVPCTAESRRAYREMLVTTPGLNEFVSGVILFDETLRQQAKEGRPFPETLSLQGIVPGVKVDKGTVAFPYFVGEKLTQGLDGLRERLAEYRQLGARFTKWRAVLEISEHTPTRTCAQANALSLAVFAALSQEAGLVPIVEPEVLMSGTHSAGRCEEVTGSVLKGVFDALFDQRVVLEHMLLKTGMVLSGSECPQQAAVQEVVERTVRCFCRFVPAAVPGVLFLSGGQSDVAATERLSALCQAENVPWRLSFSFGRALQSSALKAWRGDSANVGSAQAQLYHRAKCSGFAVQGLYSAQVESGDDRAGPVSC